MHTLETGQIAQSGGERLTPTSSQASAWSMFRRVVYRWIRTSALGGSARVYPSQLLHSTAADKHHHRWAPESETSFSLAVPRCEQLGCDMGTHDVVHAVRGALTQLGPVVHLRFDAHGRL
jgi:hypothetical protein